MIGGVDIESQSLDQGHKQNSSMSSTFEMCSGVMQQCMQGAAKTGAQAVVVCCAVSLVIGLAVGLTWADDFLDNQCTSNRVTNKSGSAMYFEGSFGTLYYGASIHVDVPGNTTVSYPFSWYDSLSQKQNCVLKARPKNSENGEPDIEVVGCSRPNAFDSGVCQWKVKDTTDRRQLRGAVNFFSLQSEGFSEGFATDYLEGSFSNKMS